MAQEVTHERSVRTLSSQYRRFFAATVVAVLLLQVTIVSDAAIVGNLLGPAAMAGVRVASPIINLLSVLFTLIGVGGSTLIAIAMGKRQREHANRIFTLTCATCILCGAVFAAIFCPLAGAIAQTISTAPESAPYTEVFLRYVALGAPAYILASVLAMLLRTDGHVRISSVVMAMAGLANVGFDLLFMGVLGLGIEGSAFATDLAMITAVVFALPYLRSRRRTLHFRSLGARDGERPLSDLVREMAKAGSPSSVRTLLSCVALLVVNAVVGSAGGVLGIALMTVCGQIQLLATAFFSAGGQAAAPMEGVLFGERDFAGLRLLVAYVLRVILLAVGCLCALCWLFPGPICSVFNVAADDPASLWCIRAYALGFLPMSVSYVLTYYYNTIGRHVLATTISVLENIVFYLPLVYVLTTGFGVLGTTCAFCASEAAALAVTLAAATLMRRKENLGSMLLLPEAAPELRFDATSAATELDAVGLAHGVSDALDACGVSRDVALRASVATEEMAVAIASLPENEGTNVFLDVRVTADDESLQVTLRDNGAPFDPTAQPDAHDDVSNIGLMRAVAASVDYRFLLGMNLTTIRIR